ncbi:MAG TPA: hypothetical protein GX509_08455, partial [Firmicutes bacterium]|nr:hypothetical protein [Bacillota bacterium]
FSRDPLKKYDDMFKTSLKIGQSVETALRQAVDAAHADGKFGSKKEALDAIVERAKGLVDPDRLPELQKQHKRLRELM